MSSITYTHIFSYTFLAFSFLASFIDFGQNAGHRRLMLPHSHITRRYVFAIGLIAVSQ